MTNEHKTVLVVEDDSEVLYAIRSVLVESDYAVLEASTGSQARQLIEERDPDLILLDLGLPDTSGLDLLVSLTRERATPVIIISGRAGEADRVIGLDLGADDYIVKPFGSRELVARVRAAFRRQSRGVAGEVLQVGTLVIDQIHREVRVGDRLVALTPKEFALLAFLARSPRQVFSAEQLLEQVWAASSQWQQLSTVPEHIYRLRHKLDPDQPTRWIENLRGFGYRLVDGEPTEPEPEPGQPQPATGDKP